MFRPRTPAPLFLAFASVGFFSSVAFGQQSASRYSARFFGTGQNQQDRAWIQIDDNANGADASTLCDVGNGSFTIDFWIKGGLGPNFTPNGGGDKEYFNSCWRDGNILIDRNIIENNGAEFGVSLAGGFVRFGTGKGADSSNFENTIEGNIQVLNNQWRHVACVRDASTGEKRIYIDGMLDFKSSPLASTADLSYPNGGVAGADATKGPFIVIGADKADSGGTSKAFSGFFDELCIWNKARSQEEILDTYNRFYATIPPGLVGYYRFEEGIGVELNNSANAAGPVGTLVAGQPQNGEWIWFQNSPLGTAPISPGVLPLGFLNSVLAAGFVEPTTFTFAPDGRIFIGERDGTIWVYKYSTILGQPMIQLAANTTAGERGLVGMAADPNFSSNGYLYVFYTNNQPRDVVSRFTVVGDAAAPASEFVIWTSPDAAALYHHGGALCFGIDGNLYIATGDQYDSATSQNLAKPYGKILRIAADGSIPPDNPYAGQSGKDPRIFASGLRNPFRMQRDPASSKIWVGDVGGNNNDSREEINLVSYAANYGWPFQEGANCYSNNCDPYTIPRFSYGHDEVSYSGTEPEGAVIAGPVYRSNAFPSPYQGNLFFADYTNRWIRRLILDSSFQVVSPALFVATPGAGTIVDLRVGPDGALYYLTLGNAWNGSPDAAALRQIKYVGLANSPPIVNILPASAAGPAPLTIQFTSPGTYDPDNGPSPLQYIWYFGDGATAAGPSASHTYTTNGNYNAVLVVSDGDTEVVSASIPVTVGDPPIVNITYPAANDTYRAGDLIYFAGAATDAEDGVLPPSALTWQVLLAHDEHAHPFLGPISNISNGSFTIPTSGHGPEHTHYQIRLTAVDSSGLQSTAIVDLDPEISNIVLDTVPSGLPIYLDGSPVTTPRLYESLVNFVHTVEAPAESPLDGVNYTYQFWLDGGASLHAITAPVGGLNVTADYAKSNIQNIVAFVFDYNRNAQFTNTLGQEYADAADAGSIRFGRAADGAVEGGFEFQSPVPKNAQILGANLQFTAAASQAGLPSANIYIYHVGDAPAFNASANVSLTNYAPLAPASVPWSPGLFQLDQVYNSPELAGLLQFAVDHPAYAEGNSVGFVVDGAPTAGLAWRSVKNYSSGSPPRLAVHYNTGIAPSCEPCGHESYGYISTAAHKLGLVAVGEPKIGGAVSFITNHATPGGAWTVFAGAPSAEPLYGGFLLVDLFDYIDGMFASAQDGTAIFEVTIPSNPAYVGFDVFAQSLCFDGSVPGGIAFSNGVKFAICSP